MSSIEQDIVSYIPRLQRYARALFQGNSAAADDLVQDSLERALSRSHQWQKGTNLRAWLFTIMHNVYVNQIRRVGNGPDFVEFAEETDESTKDTTAANMELGDLQQAIAKLTPEQREILLLVSLEGLPYQQVADTLGIPVGTVMSKLSRTRKHLRKLMHTDANASHLRRVK